MDSIVANIIAGLVVAFLVWFFDFNNSTSVIVVGSGNKKRTGKSIMILSVFFGIVGIIWAQSTSSTGGTKMVLDEGGTLLLFCSVIAFFIGKVIAWWQG